MNTVHCLTSQPQVSFRDAADPLSLLVIFLMTQWGDDVVREAGVRTPSACTSLSHPRSAAVVAERAVMYLCVRAPVVNWLQWFDSSKT